jgi:hypothetical protein
MQFDHFHVFVDHSLNNVVDLVFLLDVLLVGFFLLYLAYLHLFSQVLELGSFLPVYVQISEPVLSLPSIALLCHLVLSVAVTHLPS